MSDNDDCGMLSRAWVGMWCGYGDNVSGDGRGSDLF